MNSNREALSIEQIHEETIIVLTKIIDICEKLNIKYYMAYGSLLGVIRHNGFIPWDDDCDIIMLREDYDKFFAYCSQNEEVLYPYKLMSRANTVDYPFNVARFCDLRYEMESEHANDAGMGLFIDVYVLDGVKSGKMVEKKFNIMKKIFLQNVFSCYIDHFIPTDKGIIHNMMLFVLYKFARLFDAKYWLDKLVKFGESYRDDNSEYVTCLAWDEFYIYERKYFNEIEKHKFENLEVEIPKEYDVLLKKWYGDYMKLPPVEKRVASHNYKLYRK